MLPWAAGGADSLEPCHACLHSTRLAGVRSAARPRSSHGCPEPKVCMETAQALPDTCCRRTLEPWGVPGCITRLARSKALWYAQVRRAELGLVAAQLWQVGATGHRAGLGHAWVEHQVGQVCARPSLKRARADGAHRRAPWRHAARCGARVHHAAPAVKHHQRAAARGAPQRVPGPV